MSCGCKTNETNENTSVDKDYNFKRGVGKFFQTLVKLIGFLIFLLFIPLINVFIIIQAFRMVMFNQQIALKPLIDRVASLAKPKEKPIQETIDVKTLTKDDVVMLDVEDISEKN